MILIYIWLGLLTLALVAHMIRDAQEFSKIRRLQDDVTGLKRKDEEARTR